MFCTGKHLITMEPGCDFTGNRRSGFVFFRFATAAILLSLPTGRAVMAWQEARATIVSAYVGSVVTEELVLEKARDTTISPKPIVTPAGSAEVHALQETNQQGLKILLRVRLLRPGRCMVRLPAAWFSGRDGAERANVRVFDVRPWPSRASVAPDAIGAGVGPLTAVLEASSGSGEPAPGEPFIIRLTLTGAAAMAVEQPPDLSIDEAEPEGVGIRTIDRPLIVESHADWGLTPGRPMSRSWLYEWRSGEPGTYRIRPIRISHLDDSGQVQTKLVTGPPILVRPGAMYRDNGTLSEPSMTNRAAAGNYFDRVALAAGLLCGILAGISAILAWKWGRGHWLAWSLRRRLRVASSPELALAAWRSFEPAWRDGQHLASPDSIRQYEELRRRAFGPPPSALRVPVAGSDHTGVR